MDFSVPEKTSQFVGRVREFVRSQVQPLEPRLSQGWNAVEPHLREVRARAREAGLWTPQGVRRPVALTALPLVRVALPR